MSAPSIPTPFPTPEPAPLVDSAQSQVAVAESVANGAAGSVRELLSAKELLRNLTIRELKVRYKRSALGFLWTLLNPLLMMAVFTAIFAKVFVNAGVDRFWLYFLTGYLPFAFFQASSQVATGSIVGNANLVKKVYFPRTVLPLAVVFSQIVHLGLGLGVLFVAESVTGEFRWIPYLPVTLLAVVLLAVFTTGLSLLLAGANAFVRDIQEFTTVAFLLWFYATPVIFPLTTPPLPENVVALVKLNPLTHFVQLFRSSLYDFRWPGLGGLAAATLSAAAMFVLGWTVFNRLSPRFAKEL